MKNYDNLLKDILDRVIENNKKIQPGTPMADLKQAIESAVENLPPLEFEEYDKAINDNKAAETLVKNAPQLLGWDADHLVQWIENLSKKLQS